MDCCLPADFFLVDDVRRHDDIDPTLGAEAHVHFDAPLSVCGLRDWSKPRGPYPVRPRRSRESGNPGAMHRDVPHLDPRFRGDDGTLAPRFRGDDDEEWHPL